MRENVVILSKYRVGYPWFWSKKWNPVMKVWKKWVDVDEIWRKILVLECKYRVVTPYFDCLMKWNPVMKVWKKSELMSMRYEGKCQCFRVSIGLLPLILIVLCKWNPVTKVWKKSELMFNEIWRKMLCFRVSIGLLPLILIVSWNETLLWRFQRN